jgi:tRNA/rRNA methyltransferase
MDHRVEMNRIAIVLNGPRYPENIGAAARAAMNMGISRIHVVAPRLADEERILKMATHKARGLVEAIRYHDTLEQAVADYSYVVGTTARTGRQRISIFSPREMALKLADITSKNHAAVVFGPEDRGLSNEDLRLCHLLVTIPTADFSSLNLAQAVMVVAYELFTASIPSKGPFTPKLAGARELEGMYEDLKDVLIRISYIQPDNPEYWLVRFRRFFSKKGLRAAEVRMLRGVMRQIKWYGRNCHEKGLKKDPMP